MSSFNPSDAPDKRQTSSTASANMASNFHEIPDHVEIKQEVGDTQILSSLAHHVSVDH